MGRDRPSGRALAALGLPVMAGMARLASDGAPIIGFGLVLAALRCESLRR